MFKIPPNKKKIDHHVYHLGGVLVIGREDYTLFWTITCSTGK
jgi:hypothetical protein